MKKQALLPIAALIGMQAITLGVSAQNRQPRPGHDGGVQCWVNRDGTQQCQGGDYITPGDDGRHRPRPDEDRHRPRPRPDDDRHRPRPQPEPYYPPYQPPSEPYYPPQAPSEPYYPPYQPPVVDPYPPYQPPVDPYPPYQPPHNPPYNPGLPASYSIQQYENEVQQAIMWNQRYGQAPSGSWDERYALDQLNQATSRGLMHIQDPRAFDMMSSGDVERFGDQQNQRYGQAPSGSLLERFYLQATNIAYNALNNVLQIEVQRLSYDWRQLEVLAANLNSKYGQAPSGSIKERAYLQAARTAYGALPQAVQNEISRLYDFRQVEQIADYFNQIYGQAPSGSLKEQSALTILRQAYAGAVNKFQQQVYSLPHHEVYQIQDEYNRKFNQAPSGSAKEQYARQIRDIARNYLGVR